MSEPIGLRYGEVESGSHACMAPAAGDTLPKAPTGVSGLDEITAGGLPRGRPTLICGGAGCGKTLLAMEFLVRGALEFDEPGACITFEETEQELAENVRSLGFDVDALVRAGKLVFDHVHIDAHEIEETGEYDLGALFLRLGMAIDSVGAKRVVLDTSRRCSRASPIWRCCVLSCTDCSVGSRSAASRQ